MSFLESLKRQVARFSAHGIRGRVVMFALAAAVTPFCVLVYVSAQSDISAKILTIIALALAMASYICLLASLRPVADLAALLDQHAGDDRARDERVLDDHQRLISNVQTLATKLAVTQRKVNANPITGLPGRDYLLGAIGDELKARPDAALLGLIRVANHDHLLAFNPAAAEAMLIALSKRLVNAISSNRPLAHVDRDCFAVWFGAVGDAKRSAAELEAIGYVLMQELEIDGFTLTPDIQIGSALHPIDADEPGNLLSRAFVSLARPQRTVDGAIAFFARPTAEEARQRFSLEQDLRHAIRRNELVLHYQPVVDLAMGRVVGAEALLRWCSGSHEWAKPSEVVSVLEESGLVHEIGLWTLNAACRNLRVWRESGLADLKVAVNLSVHQLRDRALLTALTRTIAAHGLSPSNIELELTETAAMEDAARTHALFEQLREAGFSLALDDFGSGYSSLAYLRRLPFQKLKIDREFVTHVDQRADSRAICKALIDLTAGLELSVLAEGVERAEEVETLRAMGCSTFQGYYFSRPLPPEDFLKTVTDADWQARAMSRVHRDRDELRRRLT
ncbi:MAG TPA: GGDEF domain-containing phosphodiesterase [Candidatus Binatia bacterium]|nr:GGDEF domain-containing phosphodiesterase [Candidatus Binatia bacterium]